MADLMKIFGELGFPLGPMVEEARKGHPEKALEALAMLGELAEAGLLSEPQAKLLGNVLRRISEGVEPTHVFMDEQKALRGAITGRPRADMKRLVEIAQLYDELITTPMTSKDINKRKKKVKKTEKKKSKDRYKMPRNPEVGDNPEDAKRTIREKYEKKGVTIGDQTIYRYWKIWNDNRSV